MIRNDEELEATKARLRYFHGQVECNAQNYRLPAGGYLAEIDRMNLEVREHQRRPQAHSRE